MVQLVIDPLFGVPQQVDALPKPETHENGPYLVLDTNIILQQMDLLELNVPVLSRIIVLKLFYMRLET